MEEQGQVLYRKWRPQRFAEVVGQDHVTRTLRNAVATGRLAHAYLLCGPRGTGKTSLGRLIAKAVNCPSPQDGEPCNRCPSCQEYLRGQAPDLVEMDAASNRGIDEIRRLRERVGLAPMGGRYKVYLVDEVHMLTQEAHNALLKTLEEPPPHVIFVLATTEPHKLPPTIVSRCQRFDLRRIPLEAAVKRLSDICREEGFSLTAASLRDIARCAAGSLRDAINLLEQVITHYGPSPSPEQVQAALGLESRGRGRELARCILHGNLADALRAVAAAQEEGADMRRLAAEAVEFLRQLLLVQAGAPELAGLAPEEMEEVQALASHTSPQKVVGALQALATVDLREDPFSPLPLELALARLMAPPPTPSHEVALPSPPLQEEAPSPTPPPSPQLVEELAKACQQMNLSLSHYVRQATLKALEGDTLVLAFPFPQLVQQVDRPEYLEVLEQAAARVLGRRVAVRCELGETPHRPKGGHLLEEALRHGAIPLLRNQEPPQ
jgi:DNA polymerase-3 subunit gamma/tau